MVMKLKWMILVMGTFVLGAYTFSAARGDSIYGTVTAVRRANLVVFDYGEGRYDLRIIGIVVPEDTLSSAQATRFVSALVLGKHARMRFEYRGRNGEMWSRLLTADSTVGMNRDVGVELVRAGLARKQADYDYKYGELSAAENEARRARRGLWAAAPGR